MPDAPALIYTLSNHPGRPGVWEIYGTNAHQDGVLKHSVDREERTYVGPNAKARAIADAQGLDGCLLEYTGTNPDGTPTVYKDLAALVTAFETEQKAPEQTMDAFHADRAKAEKDGKHLEPLNRARDIPPLMPSPFHSSVEDAREGAANVEHEPTHEPVTVAEHFHALEGQTKLTDEQKGETVVSFDQLEKDGLRITPEGPK